MTIFALFNSNAVNVNTIKNQLAQAHATSLAQQITTADDFRADDLEAVTNENKVVVFVKNDCTYCDQVTDLLDEAGIDAYVVNMETISDSDGVKKVLDEKSGNSMVPKIFINGKYVGMLSQLK